MEHKAETKRKAIPRKVAEQKWKDPTLADWLENYADDYRLFCGDLGNEVNDDVLSRAFSRFPSFNMAKVLVEGRVLAMELVAMAEEQQLKLYLESIVLHAIQLIFSGMSYELD
ncbi:RNA-binding protein 42-like isoform X1 [Benincasa hispida]|uniref:RNA-binding protein 42-like isoform X1 n=1 Tax=Benincasa hispida TaxID=102211 RepID=UPI0018FFEE61|nr:RNA-binding protein 42-like isoform X1 [Benincasa hispida]